MTGKLAISLRTYYNVLTTAFLQSAGTRSSRARFGQLGYQRLPLAPLRGCDHLLTTSVQVDRRETHHLLNSRPH